MSNLIFLQASADKAYEVPLDAASKQAETNLEHATSSMGVPEAGHKGETVATTEAHGAGAAGEHHVDPTALGLNATAWVSLAMLAFLGILLWKKVPALIGGMLDKKIAGIRSQLDEATALRAEAETLRSEYEAKMKAAEGEAAQMRARAEEEAESIIAKAKADTTDLIARRQKMAEDRIGAAERAAVAEVREKAAQAATAAAATLIAEKHDKATDKPLIDQTIQTLGNA